jgi:PDDEXK-like domain of unknown function (DUF3799)
VTTIEIDQQGDAVVRGLPHDEYLRSPALSASGAKLLVQPGGPAKFRHARDHGQPPKRAYDVGHAVHAEVLGVDPGCDVVMCSPTKRNGEPDGDPFPALDYKTRSAQEHRDAIRAAGRVPVLASDLDLARDMAAALRQHPVASRLLHPDTGDPEVSLFWHDADRGVDRRGRVDWLRRADPSGRLILVDYKTTAAADPRSLQSAVVRYGYHQQAAWYRDLVLGLGLATSAPFLFVFQETTAPYLVHLVELDELLLQMGAERNDVALSLFAQCTADDTWPGYNDGGITTLTPPTWALYEHADLLGDDA